MAATKILSLSKLIRALKIIWPGAKYHEALKKAGIPPLSERRADSCSRFIRKINEDSVLHACIYSRLRATPVTTTLRLRSGATHRPMPVKTDRFANFVTVKYA